MKRVLLTGGAGFIGSNLLDNLLNEGFHVTVIDNFDPFYDPLIKRQNIQKHLNNPLCVLIEDDICNDTLYQKLEKEKFDMIVHLAAKPGVRPSILNPAAYQWANVNGTLNLLEFARKNDIQQFVFASSSSVYGVNENVPWSEDDFVLKPISPYASAKVSGELLGHTYSHLYGIRFIALRFFTVIGPRQRPDLVIHKFTELIENGHPIPVFGDGSTRRDYTYVGDIVKGIRAAMDYDRKSYNIFNLGNDKTITLKEVIETIERSLGKKANIEWALAQPGDVPQTWANISKARNELNYNPEVPFEEGVKRFIEWNLSHK